MPVSFSAGRTPARAPWAALLALCLILLLQGCTADLYSGLAERDANRMVAILMAHGIDADKQPAKDGTLTVRVPRDRFADAMAQLDAAGLPAERHASMGDVFRGNGLVATPAQEKAQMVYALGEELAHTIGEIDGVLSARVHVVLPDIDPLRRNQMPSSASVFVRHEPRADIAHFIPQIKTLVADSVAGLEYDRVSVVTVAATADTSSAPVRPPSFRFLGMDILDSSRGQTIWIFSLMGALALAAALLCAYLWFRRRRDITFPVTP
jgi:type III secretion protein J